jgi:Gpi18-like mannosyltransferase
VPKSISHTVDAASIPETPATFGRLRAWRLSRRDQRALGRLLCVFLLTRLLLYVTGAIAVRMAPSNSWPQVAASLGKNFSLVPWAGWDGGWYLSIAQRGYWFDPTGPSSVAFFPLFPLAVGGVAALTRNYVVAGLLVANLAALGAVLVLWRWVRREAGSAAAERAAVWLMVYPFSFYLHSIYAESLFFLLATLCLDASARQRRLAAGLWGALAAAARPMGVLLTPALAWGLWRDYRAGRRPGPSDVVAVLLPALGLGTYMAYLWVAFDDPLAVITAHTVGWRVQFHWVIARYWTETYWVLTRLVRVHTYPHLLETVRIVLPVVFVALTVQVFRRLGAVAGIYSGLTVAVVLFFALDSAGREFLAVTPAFAVMGIIGSRSLLGESLRLFCLGLLLLFVFAFASGRFVG